MQTEAPESITKLKFITLLERHCVFLQVEIMERGTDTTPCILPLWSENNLSISIIQLGSCAEMKSFKRVWDIWSAIFGAGSGIGAHPSKIGCPFLLCWTRCPLHGCFSCCFWWVRWQQQYLSCFFLALNKRSHAWLGCRRYSWIVIQSWLEEIGSKRQNGKPSSTTIAKRICHCENLGRRGQFQKTVMKDWIWQRIRLMWALINPQPILLKSQLLPRNYRCFHWTLYVLALHPRCYLIRRLCYLYCKHYYHCHQTGHWKLRGKPLLLDPSRNSVDGLEGRLDWWGVPDFCLGGKDVLSHLSWSSWDSLGNVGEYALSLHSGGTWRITSPIHPMIYST